MKQAKTRLLVRNIIIELVIYGVLLVVYFLVVLRFLGGILTTFFHDQLFLYAFLSLALVVAQAVLLETLTSFLIRMLRLDRLA